MADNGVKERARAIISQAVNAVLTTLDDQGFPHPRTMWTAGLDDDFTTYFLTSKALQKIAQIKQNPKINAFWTKVDGATIGWDYAFIKGVATISDDQALRDRFWNDALKEYFPDGSTDPNYVVIIIKPTEMMVMDGHKYPLDKVEF